jgi:hypothetical protein
MCLEFTAFGLRRCGRVTQGVISTLHVEIAELLPGRQNPGLGRESAFQVGSIRL